MKGQELTQRNQTDSLQLRSTTEMKNSLEESRFEQAEEKILELEEQTVEINQSELLKEKYGYREGNAFEIILPCTFPLRRLHFRDHLV